MSREVRSGILFLVLISVAHISMNHLLPEEYATNKAYLFHALLLTFGVMVLVVTGRVHRIDKNKTALAFSFISVVKLLAAGTLFLIQSKMESDEEKMVVMMHFIIPAIGMIAVELITARSILLKAED